MLLGVAPLVSGAAAKGLCMRARLAMAGPVLIIADASHSYVSGAGDCFLFMQARGVGDGVRRHTGSARAHYSVGIKVCGCTVALAMIT